MRLLIARAILGLVAFASIALLVGSFIEGGAAVRIFWGVIAAAAVFVWAIRVIADADAYVGDDE